ncbi:hypothetical protein QTN25_001364 [Entamoeba marina]
MATEQPLGENVLFGKFRKYIISTLNNTYLCQSINEMLNFQQVVMPYSIFTFSQRSRSLNTYQIFTLEKRTMISHIDGSVKTPCVVSNLPPKIDKYDAQKACRITENNHALEEKKTAPDDIKKVEPPKTEDDEDEDEDDMAMICKICLCNEKDCVISPCGHFVCCYDCGKRIDKCPMCRVTDITLIKIYNC